MGYLNVKGDIETIIGLAGISDGDRVLEIGCDTLRNPAIELAGVCEEVYAFDFKEKSIHEYRNTLYALSMFCFSPRDLYVYLTRRGKVQLMVADARDLPFANNCLDGVLFYRSLYFVDLSQGCDVCELLHYVHNMLRSGKSVISVECSSSEAIETGELFKALGFSSVREDLIVVGKKVLEEPLEPLPQNTSACKDL